MSYLCPVAEEIVNKVAQSGLYTLDLEEYYPREEIVVFDVKPLLFMEMRSTPNNQHCSP